MAELEDLLNQVEKARLASEKRTVNVNTSADANQFHCVTNNTVTKSHALSRAYYRFGIVEKRCMEALISKLHPLRSDNEQEIELHAREYLSAFPDAGKHAYEHLVNAGESLVSRIITIYNPDAQTSHEKIPLMSLVRYQPKAGRIVCVFNHRIVPHLIGLRERFSSYPLRKAVSFSSSYTWRFYEILVSWAQPKDKSNGRFMGWIDHQCIDELRDMLGVPKSYKWGMFQKTVLDMAQAELREKANIILSFERVKTGRRITHLNIKFIEDDQQQLPLSGGAMHKTH